MTNAQAEKIAKTIIDQLGGQGRIAAMLGHSARMMHDLADGSVVLRFSNRYRSAPNVVKISLMENDTYLMRFSRWAPRTLTHDECGSVPDLLAGDLVRTFENRTRLALTL